jgi:uncharacterized protein with von Willebrand factor type A (vWA) domain
MVLVVVAVDVSLFLQLRQEQLIVAREVASTIAHHVAGSPDHDLVGCVAYGEQAKTVSADNLRSAVSGFTYGSNLMAAIELSDRLLEHEPGRIVVVMASAPDAHNTPDGAVYFTYPPNPDTEAATSQQIVEAFAAGITVDLVAIGPFDEPAPGAPIDYLETVIETSGGRVTRMTLDNYEEATRHYLDSF